MNEVARPKRLVIVALGGNALIKPGQRGTTEEHEQNAKETAEHLWGLVDHGHNLIITHGNGPQVGDIMMRNEMAREKVPPNPLDVCVAESEGTIGYYLQQALLNKLRRERNKRFVVTVITQVLVDEQDPAFKKPNKPVGPFYTEEQARELMAQNPKWAMVEDSGRGWRRVVPSPVPKEIVQRYMIRKAGIPSRGVKTASFHVLRNTSRNPAVLVECGFISNSSERKRCMKGSHRQRLAEGIAEGIIAYKQVFR